VGRKAGISEEQLLHLPNWRQSRAFSELERLVLDYAEAMTRTPVEVPDALFRRLQSEFNDSELVELTSAIAWENYRARFNHAFGIQAQGFSEGAFCPLPDRAGSGNAGQT
jgi:4-carboxymuconolactone decarboxylase